MANENFDLSSLRRYCLEWLSNNVGNRGFTLPIENELVEQDSKIAAITGIQTHHWGQNSFNYIVTSREYANQGQLNIIFVGNASNNVVWIGECHRIHGHIFIHSNDCKVILGDSNTQENTVTIRLWSDRNWFFWGAKTTANRANFIIEGADKYIAIGDDGMLASEVHMRTSDEHAIINLDMGDTSINPPNDIKIEPHVWIGDNAKILKGVCVGFGSIVGIGSVVTKSIAPFSLAAGVPAKILKNNVSWSRYKQPEAGLVNRLKEFYSNFCEKR